MCMCNCTLQHTARKQLASYPDILTRCVHVGAKLRRSASLRFWWLAVWSNPCQRWPVSAWLCTLDNSPLYARPRYLHLLNWHVRGARGRVRRTKRSNQHYTRPFRCRYISSYVGVFGTSMTWMGRSPMTWIGRSPMTWSICRPAWTKCLYLLYMISKFSCSVCKPSSIRDFKMFMIK